MNPRNSIALVATLVDSVHRVNLYKSSTNSSPSVHKLPQAFTNLPHHISPPQACSVRPAITPALTGPFYSCKAPTNWYQRSEFITMFGRSSVRILVSSYVRSYIRQLKHSSVRTFVRMFGSSDAQMVRPLFGSLDVWNCKKQIMKNRKLKISMLIWIISSSRNWLMDDGNVRKAAWYSQVESCPSSGPVGLDCTQSTHE